MICLLHDYKNDLIFIYKTISRYINSNEKLFHIKIRKHDVAIDSKIVIGMLDYILFSSTLRKQNVHLYLKRNIWQDVLIYETQLNELLMS